MPTVRTRLTHVAVPLSLAALAVLALGAGTATARSTTSVRSPARSTNRKAQPAVTTPICHPLGTNPTDDGTNVTADIDGDDSNDTVVGLPNGFTNDAAYRQGSGSVQVELTSMGTQMLYDGEFPGPSRYGDNSEPPCPSATSTLTTART